MTEYRLAVRELAEFCHRRGDIDYRFTPSPTGEQGIAGHQQVYLRRPESYQSEYSLETTLTGPDFSLRLRGRADGYDADEGLLEEIKTCRVDPVSIPAAVEFLHWAQALLYAALVCRQEPERESLQVQLTYYNIDTGQESPRREQLSRDELEAFLVSSLENYQKWMQLQHGWIRQRDTSIRQLPFVYPEYRSGQRQMAETVYKCLAQQGQLLMQAPTGIGKTAAVLYPALKALAAGKHERLVFVTARTVGRRAAEDTLSAMSEQGLQLRRLSITARDTVCFSPGKACHGDDCPYASGYYDRLPQALEAAMQCTDLSRESVETLAREHMVCPYQLSLDLLPWADVSVGDIHYVYSFSGGIAGVYDNRELAWSVLLDEAHNLPQRGRDMFSASLSKASLMAARKVAQGGVRKALDRCNRSLLALLKGDWLEPGYDSREQPPTELVNDLQRLTAAVSEQQAQDPLILQRQPLLLAFYFELLQFQRVLDNYGPDYLFEMTRDAGPQSLILELRCLDAARLLQQRQQRPQAVVAFSATLSPPRWVMQELGFDEGAVFQDLPSPFAASQYSIRINPQLDTRYRARAATTPALAGAISEWLQQTPGNCIVYFSAYQYMSDVLDLLGAAPAGRKLCVQQRNWGEAARNELLDTLRERRDVAAFCILGGVFGEGIDLPGDALCSVVVVGVALPQFDRRRETLRQYYQKQSGMGYEYAYLYPGMQRVSQALGRVIRQSTDRGSALLIDPRYADPAYRDLLPSWWEYDG